LQVRQLVSQTTSLTPGEEELVMIVAGHEYTGNQIESGSEEGAAGVSHRFLALPFAEGTSPGWERANVFDRPRCKLVKLH